MKMKRFRVMAAALCAVVLLCGFSVPAYAYADGGEGADYLKLYDEITRLQFFIYNIVRVVPQKIYNNNILNYGRILRGAIGKDPG